MTAACHGARPSPSHEAGRRRACPPVAYRRSMGDTTRGSRTREAFRGCLLGGAIGDALGAPIEFLSLAEIRRRFGVAGVTDLVAGDGPPGPSRTTPS